MMEYKKTLECIKESIGAIPNMNGVLYNDIKKILEGSFMNDAGSNTVITEVNGYEDIEVILASGLAREIKSRSNMRRWMRMGPIHPKRYHSIDQRYLLENLS